MRIINAVFHPEFITTYLELNDTKRRKELEEASGGSPLKAFWLNLSEFVNDSENNSSLSVVLDSQSPDEDGDWFMHKTVQNDKSLNLNDFNQGTHKSCAKHMMNLMRGRNNIRKDMKISGKHAPHPSQYQSLKNMKVTKKVILPGLPVVYLDIQCMKHDSIDSAYASVLHDYLKGCSMDDDESIEDETLSKSTGSSRQDEFMTQFKDITLDLEKHQTKAHDQRDELIKMQRDSLEEAKRRASEASKAAHWSEFIKLSETVENLKQVQPDSVLLKNVAIRVREVEKLCGIPNENSIVKDL